ncbi:MAG TPA: hypothetical protein VFV66_37845 [Nonomuraea sp.]|nr:hypothetical protein [Nonomuraea sp.]
MKADPIVLLMAVFSLVLGLGIFAFFARHTQHAGRERLHAISWMLVALFPVLVIFSFFPQSQFSAEIKGATMTGAVGMFLFIWWFGLRSWRSPSVVDDLRRRLNEQDEQIEQLRKAADANAKMARPQPMEETRTYDYTLLDRPSRRITLVTGDLRNVKGVDVWVNSENTDMQMSRFHERSISAVIRYEGARRDPVTERVVDDCVADELAERVGANVPVEAGTAIVTGAHGLAERNGVMAVVHAAVVHGSAAAGYRQVGNLGACVRNVFRRAEGIAVAGRPATSMVFPIFGAGEAGADIVSTVRSMLVAIVDHLSQDRPWHIEKVCLLAYTDAELAACQEVFDACEHIRPRRSRTPPRTS